MSSLLLLKYYHAYQSYRNLSQKIRGNLLGGNHTLVVRYSLQTPMYKKCSDQIYNIAPQTALESLCRRPVFVKCLLHFRICSSNWARTKQLPGSHQTNTYITFKIEPLGLVMCNVCMLDPLRISYLRLFQGCCCEISKQKYIV